MKVALANVQPVGATERSIASQYANTDTVAKNDECMHICNADLFRV